MRRFTSPMTNGEISMPSVIPTVHFADDQRRDIDAFHYTDGSLRRWPTGRYRCLVLYRRLTSPIINGEISMPSIIQMVHFADDQWRDIDAFYYTDGSLRRSSTARYRCLLLYRWFTSPMTNGEISMPSIIQTVHFVDRQRRDIDAFYYTDGSLRRWPMARYRCLLLYRRFASPIVNGEISMPSIIQMVHFADDQRRDIDAFYYTDGSLRRWPMARYRCLLLYRRFTSSIVNGEISMPSIIQMVHFADDQWRDIDAFYYTDGSLRRSSTARYRCLLLYRWFTSPMTNGEISMPSIIQMVHFADDQWRDIDAFYYTDGSLRRSSTARYRCLLLYRRFTSPTINGEISIPSILQTVHFADDQRRGFDL